MRILIEGLRENDDNLSTTWVDDRKQQQKHQLLQLIPQEWVVTGQKILQMGFNASAATIDLQVFALGEKCSICREKAHEAFVIYSSYCCIVIVYSMFLSKPWSLFLEMDFSEGSQKYQDFLKKIHVVCYTNFQDVTVSLS